MFAGVIFPIDEMLYGKMSDHYGESSLFSISISPEKIGFEKRYDHRDDVIVYEFKKERHLSMPS